MADFTIADSATTSNLRDMKDGTLVGLIIPAGMEGTSLTFLASLDGVTFTQMYTTSGTPMAVVIDATTRWVAIPPSDFPGPRFLKLVASAVQSGAAVITPVIQRVV